MCYRVKFGSSTTKGVRIHISKPKKIGELWGPALTGIRADPLKTRPSHIKLGSSASKDVRRNRKEPQNWTALGHRPLHWGVPDTMRSSAHVFCCQIKQFESY